MDYTLTTSIPSPVRTYYDRKLLERLLPELVHNVGAESRPLKMRSGDQIKFRRFEALSAQTAPLEEGITPSPVVLDDTQITSTIGQYGSYTIITDMVSMTDIDPVISEAVGLMGENAGNSLDQVTRDVINAGTYYLRQTATNSYSTSGARTVVAVPIYMNTLRAAVRQLEGYNVKKMKSKITTGSGYGSAGIAEAYIGIVHPHVKFDLLNTIGESNGYIPVHKYASSTDLYPNEIGAFSDGIRFVMSTNAKIWTGTGATSTSYRYTGSTLDVYSVLVHGRGFFATTEMEGGQRVIVKSREQEGGPLNQRSTVGWIVEHVDTILNDYCGVRIECAATL